MTIEENKRITNELFARFSAGDLDGAFGLLADDMTWRVPGKPELMPVAGGQQYHFLFTFRGGRIASAREYLDTQHAFEVRIRT